MAGLTFASDTDSVPSKKKKNPKFEFGVITAGQYLREYRGSKATELKGIVAPYFLYRGDLIKIDRQGARAEFFKSDRFEFKVSGEASLSGGGSDSERREGMPELDSAFELGPSFNINLTGENFSRGLELNFPIRAVFTFDSFDVTQRGFTFNPKFTYKFPKSFKGWAAKAQVGALYGSQNYHGYYYDVAPEFVTSWRPEYSADSGFSGSYFRATLRKRSKSFFYAVSLRYDNLSGAVFEDSPLVETKDYFSLGFAFAYIFWTPSW